MQNQDVFVDTGEQISGQVTVTTAGTAVIGTTADCNNGVYVRALDGNTGVIYVGNDGSNDVSSSNGYELSAGQQILCQVRNVNELYFDAATNGDKVCWLKA